MRLTRRDFVHAGCIAAAVTLVPHFVDQAEALRGGLVAAFPRVQINTGFIDAGTFKNFFSAGQSMQSQTAGYAYPTILDANQVPQGLLGDTLKISIPIPSNVTSGTTLVFAWTGAATNATGAFQFQNGGAGGFTVTAGSGFVVGGTGFNLFASGTNGYIEFNYTGTVGPLLPFSYSTGSTNTGLKNLILCAKTDYASIVAATNAGQLFSTAYVNAFKGASPKTVRPMQFIAVDDSNNFTQHRYRLSWQNAFSFGNSAWMPTCWAGTQAAGGSNITGTNNYTCAAATDTPASYTMGEVIQGQFLNASTATPLMINVGSRGLVPMFDILGNSLASNAVAANVMGTLIYDDLLGGYLCVFSTNVGNGGGITCAVPVESCVGLANQVGCAIWYNLPPHISVSNTTMEPTNSVTQITALISGTIAGSARIAWANEIWNFGAGFQQTAWANTCGLALGFPNNNSRPYHGFYGLRMAQIAPLVKAAWGARSGLTMMLECFVQLASAAQTYRLNGTDLASVANGGQGNALWISYTGNANYTAFPNRPIDLVDALAYATYYSGAQCSRVDAAYSNVGGTGLTTGGPAGWTTGLLGAADAYAAGGATNIANALAFLDWDIRQGTNNGTQGSETLLSYNGSGPYSVWETVAASYDGARPSGKANLIVENYEGGCQCIAPSTSECTTLGISTTYGGQGGKIDTLLTAYKNSSLFYATVQQQYTDFLSKAHSKTGSWLELSNGTAVSNGTQFSLYRGDVYQPTWQSYAAIGAYN